MNRLLLDERDDVGFGAQSRTLDSGLDDVTPPLFLRCAGSNEFGYIRATHLGGTGRGYPRCDSLNAHLGALAADHIYTLGLG